MAEIYVFGHKNPDTDSVTSAISLAYLKNRLNSNNHYIPCILGEVNNETKFVLDYFGVDKPIYLNDTKLQIKDLNYNRNCYLDDKSTLNDLYNYMLEKDITGVPICDNHRKYLGIITMHDLLKIIINPLYDELYSSLDKITSVIKGQVIVKGKDEINGKVSFGTNYHLNNNDIIVINNDEEIIKEAINNKVQLIIVVSKKNIKEELINLAKNKKVSIIKTSINYMFVSKMLILSNYVHRVINNHLNVVVEENMYLNDFHVLFNKYKHNNYPVVSKNGKILGLLRMEDINDKRKKQVILVDHNEYSQSVDGIEEATILEIVDHHKVGNINSSEPINFRNMAVGCTNTIIYQMYKENNIIPPKKIAGLMMSGVISDTLMFHSPTTTELDKVTVRALSKLCHTEPEPYSLLQFEAASDTKGKTIEELIYNDFKSFNIGKYKIGIGQMTVLKHEKVLKNKDKYIDVIERIAKEHSYDILAFCITDIISSNTYLLFNSGSRIIFANIYGDPDIEEGHCLKGVVSRKKQIIPLLMEELK